MANGVWQCSPRRTAEDGAKVTNKHLGVGQ
jgi:hypothetical protein